MMRGLRRPNVERGFVSLLTTILISLLLSIITLSVISLEALQLRKSEDAEQSLRAYYVAEAGIENAAAKVLSGSITANQSCQTGNPTSNPTTDGVWTCQQIEFTGSPFGVLGQPDVATTVNPGSTTPRYHSVVIAWNQSNDANPAHYTMPGTFPAAGAYTAAAPPLEVQIVQYPAGGFTPTDANLTLENMVLTPGGVSGNTAVSYTAANFTTASPYSTYCAPLSQSLPGALATLLGTTTPSYNCYMVLQNLDTGGTPNNYLFRIRSRYNSSAYQMTFKTGATGNGVTVDVPTGTAILDVTAHVGTEYRRVLSELPIGRSANGGLNYVMYSDTDICKDFNVINDAAQPGCPY